MAIVSRQTGLLSAENWKKIYQTFRDADFTAYDFETLRKSMIDYIKINYAEDYNDFIESSEFIALIDVMAFLGQSLAFRTDLNARENFIDTAERRDSVLKLARLVSYTPKRSTSASGFLKILSVRTTESVYDSDGQDLSDTTVDWNDITNENWSEQFTAILNAAMVSSQMVGRPRNSQKIGGVRHDEYSININPTTLPIYKFTSSVDGQDYGFEIVSASSMAQPYVYELPPDTGKTLQILYRSDNGGNDSEDTGFFLLFKQGQLLNLDFVFNEMIPNQTVDVDTVNVNNTDIWLYKLDAAGQVSEQWRRVPSVTGINIIYNTEKERNLFQVNSRVNDQITLVFGDGAFATMPQGRFRLYYRICNGLSYKITPDELQGVLISIDYQSRKNSSETLLISASLQYTVSNALSRDSIADIKQKAPQQYYTQNRMITGEDYNILPYTNYSSVKKVKAVNRTSSGLSRYLDVLDTTGKYSSTNVFGSDGVLYADRYVRLLTFEFTNTVDIRRVVRNQVIPNIIAGTDMRHLFYANAAEEMPINIELNSDRMINGETYTIIHTGSTDWISFGAKYGQLYEIFQAENTGISVKDYAVTAITGGYVFSGHAQGTNPDITVRVGDKLEFRITAKGHPFWIKTQRVTGTNFGVSTGVITGNGSDYGTVVWDTQNVTPGDYYYACAEHSTMSGKITVLDYGDGLVRTELKWNLSTVNDGTATGYFSYNTVPAAIAVTSGNRARYMRPGAMIRCVAPPGYYFNSNYNLMRGHPITHSDTKTLFAAITQVVGNGTNNGLGNFTSGIGPVSINVPIPTGAIIQSVIPVFNNTVSDSLVNTMITQIESFNNFGLIYSYVNQAWQFVASANLGTPQSWWLKFEYSQISSVYTVYYRGINYVVHSEYDTNFFHDRSLQIYDVENNSIVRDHVKFLATNRDPRTNTPLNQDYVWYVDRAITRSDGYVENKSIYLTFADTNDDSVPDFPDLFERIVLGTQSQTSVQYFAANTYGDQINRWFKIYTGRYPRQNELDNYVTLAINNPLDLVRQTIADSPESQAFRNGIVINDNLVFFELTQGYENYGIWKLLDNKKVISNFKNVQQLSKEVLRNYPVGQLIYIQSTSGFYSVILNNQAQKVLSQEINGLSPNQPRYKAHVGQQNLYFQYRHNSPLTNRIDPNISNIVDLYVLTNSYDQNYRQWLNDITGKVIEPEAPTNTELQMNYSGLEQFKCISDTLIFNTARFKPLFGAKADTALQATFKVVKNTGLNVSDSDIKASLISKINEFFSVDNWDFGETFYFSELAAYLHQQLAPQVASVIIVPKDTVLSFGSFYQINADANEILISAATVSDVEIISAITASQLNQALARANRSVGGQYISGSGGGLGGNRQAAPSSYSQSGMGGSGSYQSGYY